MDKVTQHDIYLALTAGADVAHLTELISCYMQRPLVIIDKNFRILASSESCPVTDSVWQDYIRLGYCTFDFIREIHSRKNPPEDIPAGIYRIRKLPEAKEYKLICSMYVEGMNIGYTVLFDGGMGFADRSEEMPEMSQLLAYALKHSSDYRKIFSDAAEMYLEALLEGESPDAVEKQIGLAGYSLPERMYCFVCGISGVSQMETAFVLRGIKNGNPRIVCCAHGDYILGIVPAEEVKEGRCSIDEGICNTIGKVGISEELSGIRSIMAGWSQAMRACELSEIVENEDTLCSYENYRMADMFYSCGNEEFLREMVHPALHVLHDYDIKNGTELVKTLREYLRNGLSVTMASEKLYIHRNTMTYRLARIRELTDIDHEDMKQCFRLACSFIIAGLLHLF